jgi:hypothetical protein
MEWDKCNKENKNFLWFFDPEDIDTALFRTVGNYLSENKAIQEDLNLY